MTRWNGTENQPPEVCVVYYDDTCPLCRRAARHWQARDRQGVVVFLPISEATEGLPTGVSPASLRQAIHVRRGHSVWRGVRALAEIYRVLPGGRPIAWLLAGSSRWGFGEWLYDWLARHRHGIRLGDGRTSSTTGRKRWWSR